MNNQDVQEAFESGERIDRAMNRAFFAAVRLHRLHGVPMALWEDGKVRQVDPFTIALPEEERIHAAEFGFPHTPENAQDTLPDEQRKALSTFARGR